MARKLAVSQFMIIAVVVGCTPAASREPARAKTAVKDQTKPHGKLEPIRQVKMDHKLVAIVREVVEDEASYPVKDSRRVVNRAAAREKNRKALKALVTLTYPDSRKLKRVRVDYEINFGHGFKKRYLHTWLVKDGTDKLQLLGNFFEQETFSKKPDSSLRYKKHKEVDLAVEIQSSLKRNDFDHWMYLQAGGRGAGAGSVWNRVFNLAVYAAQHGHHDLARKLLLFGMKKEADFFWQIAEGQAFDDLLKATRSLYKTGHQAAIPHLDHLVNHFAFTKYGRQAKELLEGCRKVVQDKKKWTKRPPKGMTDKEQARYWAQRLPDVAGRQGSDPGGPTLFTWHGPPQLPSDHLVKLGPVAIPVLLEYLEDDRPVRSIYWQRSFYPHRFVVRVGGVAVCCIGKITGVRFYVRSSTGSFLFREPVEKRRRIARGIKAWWAMNKGKSRADWLRSRLDVGRVWERADTLTKLVALEGYDKCKPVLLKWLKKDDVDYHIKAASIMAANGDRSALQQIEKELLAGDYQTKANSFLQSEATYLITSQDKKNGPAVIKKYILKFPHCSNMGTAFNALFTPRSREALQACRELLDCHVMGHNPVGGGDSRIRVADVAAETFQRIVGRDFKFKRNAPIKERDKAISAMRTWWKTNGKRWAPGTPGKPPKGEK